MNLEFSVLWFDDREKYFASLPMDDIEDEIASWGFVPLFEKVSTPEEFSNHAPFQKFDLIVVDYNLGSYEDGQIFIEKIRDNSVYTEVIFYSAGEIENLWSAIHEKHLEGVFVSSRDNVISKIINVGKQSIRKVLDLENMRGIVMAEVGELDQLLDKIVTLGWDGLEPTQQSQVFAKFIEDFSREVDTADAQFRQFKENPNIEGMLALSNSNKRWSNFNRVRKLHGILNKRKKLGNYIDDVLDPRNALAHGIPEEHDNYCIFYHQNREFRFDDDVSLQLRQIVLNYKKAFLEILSIL